MTVQASPPDGPVLSQPGGVFLSWTRADTDRNGPLGGLVDRLRECGVPVWIDDGQIEAFDAIGEHIRDGLSQSRVLLAWYSQGYPTRRACREELTLALLAAQRDNQAGRVLVVNPETDAGHVLEAQLLQRRFGTAEDLQDLDALADRVQAQVAAHTGPFGALPASDRTTWYGGQGWQSGSRRFVGRLPQLWKLHDLLTRTTQLAGPGAAGRAVALVSGLGGVGKSLLATEYAQLFASSYPGGVVWLSALGNDTAGATLTPSQSLAAADTAYSQLATHWLHLDVQGLEPAAVRQAVADQLASRCQPVLWIIDDLPSGLDPAGLAAWRCSTPLTHELITTRDRRHTSLPAVNLDVLEPEDALALLLQGAAWPEPEVDQAKLLRDELGCHPLACDVAGLYVNGASSFTGYRQILHGNLMRFDELARTLSDQLPGGHERQIAATLGTSLSRLSAAGSWLLRAAAELAPTDIPRQLLLDMLTRPGQPEEEAAEITLGQALHDRHQDGLWSYNPTAQVVDVHVLVRAASATLSSQADREVVRQAAIAAMVQRFEPAARDIARHGLLTGLSAHARQLTSVTTPTDRPTLTLLGLLAHYDYTAGRPTTAAEQFERGAVASDQLLGPDHPDTVTSRNNLASAYQAAGRLPEALPLFERTLTDCERLLGPDHPNTLTSRNNLAFAYQAAGRLPEALPLYERTLTDCERLLGPDHPDTLTSRNNLAGAYLEAGCGEEAAQLLEQVRTGRERALGPDHPDTRTTRTP